MKSYLYIDVRRKKIIDNIYLQKNQFVSNPFVNLVLYLNYR